MPCYFLADQPECGMLSISTAVFASDMLWDDSLVIWKTVYGLQTLSRKLIFASII